MTPSVSVLERRFWSRVDKTGLCWIWRGAKFNHGYGKVVRGGKFRLAHRVAYELERGPIPDGLFACHRCDVRICVNPEHMFLGTPQDNMTDMVKKGRSGRLPGQLNGRAKLTPEQVAEIRRRHRHGLGSALAREYGVAPTQLREIVHGESWRG